MEHRNLTLRLDKALYRQVKILAASRDTSISALVAEKLVELVDEDAAYKRARSEALEMLEAGMRLGTEGAVTWSRDDLHER